MSFKTRRPLFIVWGFSFFPIWCGTKRNAPFISVGFFLFFSQCGTPNMAIAFESRPTVVLEQTKKIRQYMCIIQQYILTYYIWLLLTSRCNY